MINILKWNHSPTVAGLPQQARHIAWVTVDFPVPLGPRMTFKRGPGKTSQSSNVKKLCIRTLRTEPLRYPFFLSCPTLPLPLRYSADKSSLSGIFTHGNYYFPDIKFRCEKNLRPWILSTANKLRETYGFSRGGDCWHCALSSRWLTAARPTLHLFENSNIQTPKRKKGIQWGYELLSKCVSTDVR